MRKANNLNQLLSRVKSIFGRKATPATATTPNAEPPTDLSVVSDPRLSAAFADIEKYLAENYGTPTAKLSYQDYTNGASFFSKDAVFAPSLVILTDSDGLYNLPDDVMMLVTVTSIKDENWLIEELGKFILFLKELGSTHRIQHFAIAFSKELIDLPLAQQEPRPSRDRPDRRCNLPPPLLINNPPRRPDLSTKSLCPAKNIALVKVGAFYVSQHISLPCEIFSLILQLNNKFDLNGNRY